jgi:hypothetical protein
MFNGYMTMGAGGWVLVSALSAVVACALLRLVPARREEPREVLDRRLAQGEIDVQTYERLRSELLAEGR